MPIRTLRLVPSGQMAASLIARAELQAREGVAPFKTLRTGLPSLDAIPSWWGVTTIVGPHAVANRALAVRVALEAAKTGENVLWLCIAGNSEGTALRMVAGPAGIRVRRVFVDRDLTKAEWKRLRRAAAQFSRLPIQFADAHGSTLAELGTAYSTAAGLPSDRNHRPSLVVIDGIDALDRALMSGVECLAEDTETPFMVIGSAMTNAEGRPLMAVHSLPLRPGSLVLDVSQSTPHRDSVDQGPEAGLRQFVRLTIRRLGTGECASTTLCFDADTHRLDEMPIKRTARARY